MKTFPYKIKVKCPLDPSQIYTVDLHYYGDVLEPFNDCGQSCGEVCLKCTAALIGRFQDINEARQETIYPTIVNPDISRM